MTDPTSLGSVTDAVLERAGEAARESERVRELAAELEAAQLQLLQSALLVRARLDGVILEIQHLLARDDETRGHS